MPGRDGPLLRIKAGRGPDEIFSYGRDQKSGPRLSQALVMTAGAAGTPHAKRLYGDSRTGRSTTLSLTRMGERRMHVGDFRDEIVLARSRHRRREPLILHRGEGCLYPLDRNLELLEQTVQFARTGLFHSEVVNVQGLFNQLDQGNCFRTPANCAIIVWNFSSGDDFSIGRHSN